MCHRCVACFKGIFVVWLVALGKEYSPAAAAAALFPWAMVAAHTDSRWADRYVTVSLGVLQLCHPSSKHCCRNSSDEEAGLGGGNACWQHT